MSSVAHSCSMMPRRALASASGVDGESALVYAMPNPPPRSSSPISTPVAVRTRRAAGASGGRRPRTRPRRRSAIRCGSGCRPGRAPGASWQARKRLSRGAAGDREAELLVLVRGGDVLVGVRFDPGGDPDHDPRTDAELGRQPAEPGDLVERVDDDPADPGGEALAQFVDALVVAVQADPVERRRRPVAPRRAHRRCRRRCRDLPRSPSGRPRSRGTTCRRSRHPSRRRRRRRPERAPAGRLRPPRRPACPPGRRSRDADPGHRQHTVVALADAGCSTAEAARR